MQRLGELLKNKREERGLSLEEVCRATKIRKEFLKALEEGNYQLLPPPPFLKGFIRSYASFLDLPVDKLLPLFRREYDRREKFTLLPRSTSVSLFPSFLERTQNRIFLFWFFFLFLVFFLFLTRRLLFPPPLELLWPEDNLSTSQSSIEVVGKVRGEVKVVINGQEVFPVQGKFSTRIPLKKGINKIVIVATNKLGRSRRIVRTVTFVP